MGTKRRAVVNAEIEQLEAVETLIEDGRYQTLSEFVREAIGEKLERLRQDWLAEEVERYCRTEPGADEMGEQLVAAQAFEDRPTRAKTPTRKTKARRAKR
jgi:Arc/MetJ-type ribon-helix-helix transcriptional regulator